ncbi:hypothetical protein G3A43_42615 [Paraburkholderia aspalathi]|uniref:hypothetical protein n=1 Tax=Paraburkholderia nemoris TaxID=2793076 RepID=UPI00190BA93E|nr:MULTISPECIES: hypothetical protein [Paraburkholderia]MBK3786869.1 hypothetical protein [Paraburkholderia aspalathi]
MSPLHQAFVTELGRTGASDAAFTLAVVLTRVLNTWTYKSFSAYAAAKESGLSLPELRRAVEELVDLRALDVRKKACLGRRMTLYRLGKVIVSRTNVFVTAPENTESAYGDADQ